MASKTFIVVAFVIAATVISDHCQEASSATFEELIQQFREALFGVSSIITSQFGLGVQPDFPPPPPVPQDLNDIIDELSENSKPQDDDLISRFIQQLTI